MWTPWIWFMNDEFEHRELEQRVHRELRRLSEPEAPETLLHRVMLAEQQDHLGDVHEVVD